MARVDVENIMVMVDAQTILLPHEKEKINVELLKQWIRDLRDPQYKQARGCLARKRKDGEIGRCCLGLLCKAAGLVERKPTLAERRRYSHISRDTKDMLVVVDDTSSEGFEYTMPTDATIESVGIQYIKEQLVDLNDNARGTYNDIANYVEKYMINNGVLDAAVV